MCGIVGIVQPETKGAVDPSVLRAMNASLVHRGPDDEGYWLEREVGLAMRRLSIIDVEGGHQPVSNETEEIWTVFNGEIYNFRELRESLVARGHLFRTRSDTEVIVHLYEEEGEGFVHKLRGMFAVAIWDSRGRKLLLYRDRLGIKPLYYWSKNGVLVFGSEIKAILEYPDVDREISLPALGDFLSFLYIPAPNTIYRDIRKLLPGHYLRYHEGETEIRPYWELKYAPDENVTEKGCIEKLRDLLDECVRMHLVSDVPLGAFLSGGMDSSTVVAWMSRHVKPVKTFSIGFPDPRFNELPYAREVAACFGTDHHEQIVEADAVELLPKILAGFDEPFADSSALPTYLVSEFAHREVAVALSGDGGDELFGGYLWTQKEIWLERYRALPAPVRNLLQSLMMRKDFVPLREQGLLGLARRFLFDARLSPWESYARRASCFQPWMKKELLQKWVWEEVKQEDHLALIRSFYERGAAQTVIDKLMYLDAQIYLPDDLLTKVDRMSMMHSLEVRVPLLDHRLVEWAAAIPFPMKFRRRQTKYILKKAMKGILPNSILEQRKQGFSIPLDRWFRDDLYGVARDALLDQGSLCQRFLRAEYVRWLLEEHRRGRQRFGAQLYALLVLELWCRHAAERSGEFIGRRAS